MTEAKVKLPDKRGAGEKDHDDGGDRAVMQRNAILDVAREYRYTLERTWNPDAGRVLFIMLNPSTADADFDDATIRRCTGFAASWGKGGIVRRQPFRPPVHKPQGSCWPTAIPSAPRTTPIFERLARECNTVVAAWGNSARRSPAVPGAPGVCQRTCSRAACSAWAPTGTEPRNTRYGCQLRPGSVRSAEEVARVIAAISLDAGDRGRLDGHFVHFLRDLPDGQGRLGRTDRSGHRRVLPGGLQAEPKEIRGGIEKNEYPDRQACRPRIFIGIPIEHLDADPVAIAMRKAILGLPPGRGPVQQRAHTPGDSAISR